MRIPRAYMVILALFCVEKCARLTLLRMSWPTIAFFISHRYEHSNILTMSYIEASNSWHKES